MTEQTLIRTLADVREIEKVPLAERVPFDSTYEMIRTGAGRDPQKVAIHFIISGEAYQNPISITYEQLLGRIHQAANLFHDVGVAPGAPVGVILPNLPQIHFAIWGGEAAGTICMLNPFLGADGMRDILRTAKVRALVALGPTPGVDIWEKVMTIRRDLPDLQTIFQVMGPGDEKEGIYSFDESLGKYRADRFDFDRVIRPGDVASLFHTGGTTGSPKLAQHTHHNEICDAWAGGFMAGIQATDVTLCGLPLFHVNAVIVTGLIPFSSGATVVMLAPAGYRDQAVIRNFYKIVEHYRATTFSGVPTLYASLLQVPVGDGDVSSLRYAICGAAAMPVDVFKEFERRTGIRILEGYGLTEGTCISSVNPKDGERRIGSIGLSIPYQQMKTAIVGADGKLARDCAPREIGVVALKGPNVFPGYLQPEHNAMSWLGDGWFNTGDLGYTDEDGYFWLTGRAKELIIRGGHNIDPAIIEDALYKHPAVQLAAAVGRPDAYAGEVPVAYVALRPGNQATEEELLTFCQATVGERAAVPKEVRILESLPLTTVGKLFKPQLRWDATIRVFSQELAAIQDVAEKFTVDCGEDKRYGTLARIAVWPKAGVGAAAVEERVNQALGRYTVKFVVEMRQG